MMRALILLGLLVAGSGQITTTRAAQVAPVPEGARLWSMREGREVPPQALVDAARAVPFVLAGEVHDNALHHALQAWLIGELASAGARPTVVWEMVRADKADVLAGARDAAALGEALEWSKAGWPDWAIYRPVAEAALSAGLPMRAGDAPREDYKAMGRHGLDALLPERRAALRLDAPLPAAAQAALLDEMKTSHCGLLPEGALKPMADMQRFRDASIAAAARAAGSAIVIAGNGHTRRSAVPSYLGGPSVSIVALEAAEAGDADADYVWLTPPLREARADPCDAMRPKKRA